MFGNGVIQHIRVLPVTSHSSFCFDYIILKRYKRLKFSTNYKKARYKFSIHKSHNYYRLQGRKATNLQKKSKFYYKSELFPSMVIQIIQIIQITQVQSFERLSFTHVTVHAISRLQNKVTKVQINFYKKRVFNQLQENVS